MAETFEAVIVDLVVLFGYRESELLAKPISRLLRLMERVEKRMPGE